MGTKERDLWQWSKADGSPDWSVGSTGFDHSWDRGYDLLRFHRGDGFTITNRKTGEVGPKRSLKDIRPYLLNQLQTHPNTVMVVDSVTDGYGIAFRRVVEPLSVLGEKWLEVGYRYIGTPYVLGGMDCSGLTRLIASHFEIDLPHNAAQQHDMFRNHASGFYLIDRKDIRHGDLIFHHDDDHVSSYVDDMGGYGRVLDTEPHGVMGPWGSYISPGVRVRPMNPNYYCEWAYVNGIGRLSAINGQP